MLQNELHECQEELSKSQNLLKEMTIERNDMMSF